MCRYIYATCLAHRIIAVNALPITDLSHDTSGETFPPGQFPSPENYISLRDALYRIIFQGDLLNYACTV